MVAVIAIFAFALAAGLFDASCSATGSECGECPAESVSFFIGEPLLGVWKGADDRAQTAPIEVALSERSSPAFIRTA